MDPRRQTSKLYHTIRSVIYDNSKGHVLESADTAKAFLRYCTLTYTRHPRLYIYHILIFLFRAKDVAKNVVVCDLLLFVGSARIRSELESTQIPPMLCRNT